MTTKVMAEQCPHFSALSAPFQPNCKHNDMSSFSTSEDVDLMYLPFPESIDPPSGTKAPSFFHVSVEMIE